MKEVPDAGPLRRIDPATKRIDRSGDKSLNTYDLNAIEEALRLNEAGGGGEVVLVCMGPDARWNHCARVWPWVPPAWSGVRRGRGRGTWWRTSLVLAEAITRESPDLVLFGQQAGDSDGAVLWAAVADRLQLPVISQVSELTTDGGSVTAKRQTEFGYDTIQAPLPAILAVSDALNEPRYPSLKGIMGAKKKPQEVLSLGGPRRSGLNAPARPVRGPWSTRSTRPPRAATRRRSKTMVLPRRRSLST